MEKLLLIDGHSILSRAYYGIPRLSTGDGRATNAVYGFMNILLKVLTDLSPDYIGVSFDLDRKQLFRTKMYPEYKGTRKPMPSELLEQVPVMQQLLKAMNIPVFTCIGYEADDVLGTLSHQASADGMDVTVLSGDRDLLQLAGDHVTVMLPKTSKGETEVFVYHPEDVARDYQVTPKEFIDVKALMGDSSDNIPGLPGVGEKTATEIIKKYHSIENALEHIDEIKPPKAQNAFRDHFELAKLSKDLATIRLDAPVIADVRSGRTGSIYTSEALTILRDLELKTLVNRFLKFTAPETNEVRQEIPPFQEISDPFKASVLLDDCSNSDRFGFSWKMAINDDVPVQLSLFSEEPVVQEQLCISLYLPGTRFCVIRSGEHYPANKLLSDLQNFFENCIKRTVQICVLDKKNTVKRFPVLKDAVLYDVSLASYLLNPVRGEYTAETIAKDHLGIVLKSEKELLADNPDNLNEVLANQAYVAMEASSCCLKKLDEAGMSELYMNIELPLCTSLAEMELTGIRADREALDRYSQKLLLEIVSVEKQIHELAGEAFNINSPVQLGAVLFEKLGLPGGKKTKKGYSTAADVLDKLAPEHEIVKKVLRYRTLTKLNSTYAVGLKSYIEDDGRIHGTFHQTVTATGRISSTDPNLQNIPVRTEEGRELRKVFVPEEGFIFVDADYSQVELRILASLSGDENLIQAYNNSVDIHTETASRVFHVPLDQVTGEMRRNAKAVNFGIVYGISAFGLGEGLSISRKEALEYINTYFETYPKVKTYLDEQVSCAKEKGFVTTYFGRIRPIPELRSSNFMERAFGERIAMNSPIQGTAADIIKIAMNRVNSRLSGMKSRIVLQVHDELLVEASRDELETVKCILKEEMENAAKLPVPLKVEVEIGSSWNECH